jgi:DNA-binding transcriptional LysR family regulator
MDQLQAMRVFARVAERSSFSAVARELEITQSQVSRLVAQLEERLSAALFTRTTRQVQLTPEGLLYLESVRKALNEVDEAEALIRGGRQTLSGNLRITTSAAILQYLVFDPLEALMAQNPELQLDLQVSDHLVDLVTEGIDLAIRGGQLNDSGLVARKICDLPFVVAASPEYLARSAGTRPPIVVPHALEQHDCLRFTGWREPIWRFEDESGHTQAVSIRGRWRFSQGQAVREGLLRHLGVGEVPRFLVQDLLAEGRLVELLAGFRPRSMPLHAVYPASRRQVARVEAVVQALLQALGPNG